MSEEQQEIRTVYQEVQGKPTIAATGAYGGPTPDGASVAVHLYAEYGAIPNVVKTTVNVKTGEIIEKDVPLATRADGMREVQATLILSPEAAIAIGDFLATRGRMAAEFRDSRRNTTR